MYRMTKDQEKQATEELLEILAKYPNGLPTSLLPGTRKFHGERILTNRQVIRLLRASGKAKESTERYGMYSQMWWTLKK